MLAARSGDSAGRCLAKCLQTPAVGRSRRGLAITLGDGNGGRRVAMNNPITAVLTLGVRRFKPYGTLTPGGQ
jgi:hypothetical protein